MTTILDLSMNTFFAEGGVIPDDTIPLLLQVSHTWVPLAHARRPRVVGQALVGMAY